MPNQVQRNVQDALFAVADFALPAAASTSTTSAVIDLGADAWKTPQIDFLLTIPVLSTTIAPDTRTVTAIVETSTTSIFTAVDATIFSRILTGAGGVGIGAQTALTCRAPANCARYVRAKVTFGASTTDGSAVSASFSARF